MYITLDQIVIDGGLDSKCQLAYQRSERDRLAGVSSKKKRLTGRLGKYVIFDSGSCAFAKRADKRVISKARKSGPLDVEPIAALVETACVDLQAEEGVGSARQLRSVSITAL